MSNAIGKLKRLTCLITRGRPENAKYSSNFRFYVCSCLNQLSVRSGARLRVAAGQVGQRAKVAIGAKARYVKKTGKKNQDTHSIDIFLIA